MNWLRRKHPHSTLLNRFAAGSVLFLLMSACHSAQLNSPMTLDQIRVVNTLESCLGIEPLAIEPAHAGAVLRTRVSHHKSLAECLCMTTLMNYQVVEERLVEGRTIRTEWVRGFRNTATQPDGPMDLVLLTDPTYIPRGKLVLELRCRPHE